MQFWIMTDQHKRRSAGKFLQLTEEIKKKAKIDSPKNKLLFYDTFDRFETKIFPANRGVSFLLSTKMISRISMAH